MDHDSNQAVQLTPLQLGMIYHYLREGRETGADVVQVEVRLSGQPDVERLREAWGHVIDRTPSLKLSFNWEGGEEPFGVLHDRLAVQIKEVDLSGHSGGDDRLRDLLKEDRARGLELSEAPVFRLVIYRLGDEDHRMVWTLHHVLADGASYGLVLEDVFSLYDAEGPADPGQLPDRPPFEPFVQWLVDRDDGGDEDFWRELVGPIVAPTPLPRVPGGRTDPGAWEYLRTRLDPEVTAALRDAATRSDVTLNTLVQAAWAITLSRFAGTEDVVYGAIRGGRAGTVEGAREMIGLFIETVPIPVRVEPDASVPDLLRELRDLWVAMREHEHASPADIQRWSSVPPGSLLFESVLNFQEPFWGDRVASSGEAWDGRSVDMHNRLVFPLTVAVNAAEDLAIRFEFDPSELDRGRLGSMLESLESILRRMSEGVDLTLSDLTRLSPAERERIVVDWNRTDRALEGPQTVHGAFEAMASKRSDDEALVSGKRTLTFGELDAQANRIARALCEAGVQVGDRVAVSVERDARLVSALLGVMKAGAAYVPVDPRYPEDRVRLMLEDSRPSAVLTDRSVQPRLPDVDAPVLVIDEPGTIDGLPDDPPAVTVGPSDLAYVIYTSGSTGRPKGVMVEHRNVVNFFLGMDDEIGIDPAGTWLAVTSISFDISVLEIFWTLARGYRVVLHSDRPRSKAAQPLPSHRDRSAGTDDRIDFSLFYFSAEGEEGQEPPPPGRDRYRLLLEGARFADENGLSAVWTPERHFHEFGGIYPNPSVTAAALAATTRRVRIRAGSVVLPLHDPIRVAEEWSVVDNLSDGRVDLSFASGWHDRDFVLRPHAYEDRRAQMFEAIRTVRKLWRGQAVDREGPSGNTHSLRLFPRPVQPELPFWVTAGGSPDTFRKAGEAGGNLLTHLLGQKPEELKEKIRIYREAWQEAGHPGTGHVSLMLHTFIGPDMDFVRERTRTPFRNYLRTAVGLIQAVAKGEGQDLREAKLSESEMDALLDHAFDRYFETSSLMGTPDRCVEIVERMRGYGVDEIACLIDFGVEDDAVLEGLRYLPEVLARVNGDPATTGDSEADAQLETSETTTVSSEILRTGATHLQCTPSQASLILAEEGADEALSRLRTLCIGGEAFPGDLARKLKERTTSEARLLNMYGPTETTIWSSVHVVGDDDLESPTVPLGSPIANTRLLVVDASGAPVPAGVDGELLIGGAGVVRGYLDRDELTAERFVESPVEEWPGRFYRTGDLARWRDDGILEFLGRSDDQVKLLGHRIEPGEIEAALVSHPDVREAVVVLRTDDGPESARLVAYVIPRDSLPERSSLRAFLAERLPDVMIPAEFVGMESFPLTPNQKVDRAGLPSPSRVRSPRRPARPEGESGTPGLEGVIAGIWQEVLGVPEVGLDQNFFEIGGHSLLAVRVHSRLSRDLDGSVTLIDLFRFPTVRGLAEHLGGRGAEGRTEKLEDAQDRAAARRRALGARGSRER
jgi:natural product biosynthesis luciferase-like monooxygenase protein